MALAETAQLITELSLRDNMSPGLSRATGAVSAASRGISGLSSVASGAGNALNTFKGRVGSLVSGPLGLIGLGAAAFGVGKFLEGSVTQAKDFGAEVVRMSALTGLGATTTSQLAAAFEHFGISAEAGQRAAGLAEKNIFKLAGTTKHAEEFQRKYGLSLVDSKGQLNDFNTILLDSADYFNNKSIPAAQKAAGLAAIYGRGWQSLIPILSAGRQGIADVEAEAAKLGLTLTDQNLKDLIKLRDNTRDWTTALGGLKLQIGLALVPALTNLTGAATNFLKNGGREQIVGFFKNLIAYGQQVGDVVSRDVIPIFKGIYGAWQTVPSGLRDLIIKGFAADRTIKFLFGVSPISLAGSVAGTLLGFIGKLGAQKLVPQLVTAAVPIPVFVTNPGFGLPGGGGGVAGAAGGAAESGGLGLGAAAAGFGLAALADLIVGAVGNAVFKAANPTVERFNEIAGAQAHMAPPQLLSTINSLATRNHTDSDTIKRGIVAAVDGQGLTFKQAVALLDAGHLATIADNTALLKKPFVAQLHGAPGGGHPGAAPILKLDDKALIAALAKTSEFGYKGKGTTIEHGPLTGTDFFGEQALALFRRAEFPTQGKTLGEIRRHIIAAEQVQREVLSHGDTASARRLQVTIDGLHRLIGSVDRQRPFLASVATATYMQSGKLAAIDGRLGVIARKNFSPTIRVNVSAIASVSVSNVVRTINSYVAAVGSGPGGAVSNPY